MHVKQQSLFVVVLVLVGLCLNVKRVRVVSLQSADSGAAPPSNTASRRRKIILLGPHDRFNFGDLLFEKIVSKLLITQRNYTDEDFVRAGLVNVNMTRFGGHSSIVSIKRARRLSQSEGGYHIVYTGGESMGCSVERGVIMLPNNHSREYAKRHKVSDCAYLLPKDQLSTNKNTVAVVNSVGGMYNLSRIPSDCRTSVETADYVAFRDLPPNETHLHVPSAQMRPDSAVMTSVLFNDTISEYGNEGEVKAVRNQGNYLAIQFKETDLYWSSAKMIARVLDEIHNHTNLTTVFFQAGTVPNHDSLALYHKVSRRMKTPFHVFTTPHLWSVVALIRFSSAVISTSLHVRIMAFVHARPRVTICTSPGKHTSFIELWESNDATACEETFERDVVWKSLNASMATSPNATYAAQDRAIDSYLQGFDEWSGLFDIADGIKYGG